MLFLLCRGYVYRKFIKDNFQIFCAFSRIGHIMRICYTYPNPTYKNEMLLQNTVCISFALKITTTVNLSSECKWWDAESRLSLNQYSTSRLSWVYILSKTILKTTTLEFVKLMMKRKTFIIWKKHYYFLCS